ncbi:MAG: HAMP domain-containing protein [Deltaproteobacteria bacterium]|nr:HAMP domain-containing protein [Deltaproteobacteria bacterium]
MSGLARALDGTVAVRWWQRFQTRLLSSLILLSVATSLAAGSIYYTRQVKFVEEEQAKRGATLISNLAGQSELGAYSGDRAFLMVPARRAFLEADVNYVQIYNSRGDELVRMAKPDVRPRSTLPPGMLEQLLADPSGRPTTRRHESYDDLLAPIVTLQGSAEEGMFGEPGISPSTVIGVARLGLSRTPAEAKLREILRWGTYLTLIVLVMGVLLALFLARRISQPVLELARGADELHRGRLGYQLEVHRSDELGLLAESFNRMSAKLRDTVDTLAHLNRNLEQEVASRTVALRRSRDFIALLNAPLQLHRLLDTALDALVRVTRASAGAAYLATSPDQIELAVSQGLLTNTFDAQLTGAEEIVRQVTEGHRAVVVVDLPEDTTVRKECPDARAVIYAPVRHGERLEAVVVLALAAPPPDDVVDFVEHAGPQLAIAVSNARAYAAAERLARDLEQRNVTLQQQRDQLQEMNRLKSQFLANISHELRTPLNAIIGYTELLADGIYGEVSAEQAQSLGGIGENATHLLQLINEILDLSKVEAGKMTLAFTDVNLPQLVRDVVDHTAPLVRDRPYQVETSLPEGALRVVTDAAKVRQIVANLLSNAVKFTQEGSVRVVLEPRAEGGATIQVIDTGIGIRPEHLDVIFDEFRQVDGSSTRQHGGTGLGLAISRKLATMIGGQILVESRHGQGSRFTLIIPRGEPKAEAPRSPRTRPEVELTLGERHVGRS